MKKHSNLQTANVDTPKKHYQPEPNPQSQNQNMWAENEDCGKMQQQRQPKQGFAQQFSAEKGHQNRAGHFQGAMNSGSGRGKQRNWQKEDANPRNSVPFNTQNDQEKGNLRTVTNQNPNSASKPTSFSNEKPRDSHSPYAAAQNHQDGRNTPAGPSSGKDQNQRYSRFTAHLQPAVRPSINSDTSPVSLILNKQAQSSQLVERGGEGSGSDDGLALEKQESTHSWSSGPKRVLQWQPSSVIPKKQRQAMQKLGKRGPDAIKRAMFEQYTPIGQRFQSSQGQAVSENDFFSSATQPPPTEQQQKQSFFNDFQKEGASSRGHKNESKKQFDTLSDNNCKRASHKANPSPISRLQNNPSQHKAGGAHTPTLQSSHQSAFSGKVGSVRQQEHQQYHENSKNQEGPSPVPYALVKSQSVSVSAKPHKGETFYDEAQDMVTTPGVTPHSNKSSKQKGNFTHQAQKVKENLNIAPKPTSTSNTLKIQQSTHPKSTLNKIKKEPTAVESANKASSQDHHQAPQSKVEQQVSSEQTQLVGQYDADGYFVYPDGSYVDPQGYFYQCRKVPENHQITTGIAQSFPATSQSPLMLNYATPIVQEQQNQGHVNEYQQPIQVLHQQHSAPFDYSSKEDHFGGESTTQVQSAIKHKQGLKQNKNSSFQTENTASQFNDQKTQVAASQQNTWESVQDGPAEITAPVSEVKLVKKSSVVKEVKILEDEGEYGIEEISDTQSSSVNLDMSFAVKPQIQAPKIDLQSKKEAKTDSLSKQANLWDKNSSIKEVKDRENSAWTEPLQKDLETPKTEEEISFFSRKTAQPLQKENSSTSQQKPVKTGFQGAQISSNTTEKLGKQEMHTFEEQPKEVRVSQKSRSLNTGTSRLQAPNHQWSEPSNQIIPDKEPVSEAKEENFEIKKASESKAVSSNRDPPNQNQDDNWHDTTFGYSHQRQGQFEARGRGSQHRGGRGGFSRDGNEDFGSMRGRGGRGAPFQNSQNRVNYANQQIRGGKGRGQLGAFATSDNSWQLNPESEDASPTLENSSKGGWNDKVMDSPRGDLQETTQQEVPPLKSTLSAPPKINLATQKSQMKPTSHNLEEITSDQGLNKPLQNLVGQSEDQNQTPIDQKPKIQVQMPTFEHENFVKKVEKNSPKNAEKSNLLPEQVQINVDSAEVPKLDPIDLSENYQKDPSQFDKLIEQQKKYLEALMQAKTLAQQKKAITEAQLQVDKFTSQQNSQMQTQTLQANTQEDAYVEVIQEVQIQTKESNQAQNNLQTSIQPQSTPNFDDPPQSQNLDTHPQKNDPKTIIAPVQTQPSSLHSQSSNTNEREEDDDEGRVGGHPGDTTLEAEQILAQFREQIRSAQQIMTESEDPLSQNLVQNEVAAAAAAMVAAAVHTGGQIGMGPQIEQQTMQGLGAVGIPSPLMMGQGPLDIISANFQDQFQPQLPMHQSPAQIHTPQNVVEPQLMAASDYYQRQDLFQKRLQEKLRLEQQRQKEEKIRQQNPFQQKNQSSRPFFPGGGAYTPPPKSPM